MTRHSRICLPLCLSLALAPTTMVAAADRADEIETLAGQVAEAIDSYLDAISSRDEWALRSIYADDDRFVWLEQGAFQYQTVAEVVESLAGFGPQTPISTEVSNLEVTAVGESGALASMAFNTTVGAGEAAFSFSGVMSLVLESSDGVWKIVGGHSSTPGMEAAGEG